jgi:tRNA modification GTPase
MYKEDTIAAIATPVGEGGVAIIRVSGPDAERIAAGVFARNAGKNGTLKSNTLYHGTIRDSKTDNVLDEVLLAVMRKPRSYTGEDVVEIHCHGGIFLVREILGLVLSQGARQAEPGEFTKRAFLNGKLDLAQAEAVLDLIQARTNKAVELARNQVEGSLSSWVRGLREDLLDILVQVEAAVDFPEEDIELLQGSKLIEKISSLELKIIDIIGTYEWGRLFREGASVCICGRPNVGKSSLLNSLLGEERVIVTPVPGTTRDVIEESINLGGLPAVLWDTAGIRETSDEIETIGVNLSRQHLEKADAVLLVLDGSESLTDEDRALLELNAGKKAIIVVNKNDLPQKLNLVEAAKVAMLAKIVSVSAKTKAGVDELQNSLRELLIGSKTEAPIVLTNLRHRSALIRSREALSRSVVTLKEHRPPELVAVDLNAAREGLEEVIGVINNEDILERVFSSFCIGK